jgi:hypothetical protein
VVERLPVSHCTIGFDDGNLDGDGALEPDGVFGNPQTELAIVEGQYTFRARAVYGDDCPGMRETSWSTHIDVGIDPGKTDVSTEVVGDLPDGRHRVRIHSSARPLRQLSRTSW